MIQFKRSIIGLCVAASLAAGAASAQSVSFGPVVKFAGGSSVDEARSALIRTGEGLTATLLTRATPNDVYTLWWVVFNKPENCSGGVCDEDDVLPPPGNIAAEVSVLYAAGAVADQDGKVEFGAGLAVGETDGVLFGPGLIDPRNAEVHLVIRTHGQIDLALLQDQLSSFDGGCPPNQCEDEQFSVHLPGADATSRRIERIDELTQRIAQRLGLRP